MECCGISDWDVIASITKVVVHSEEINEDIYTLPGQECKTIGETICSILLTSFDYINENKLIYSVVYLIFRYTAIYNSQKKAKATTNLLNISKENKVKLHNNNPCQISQLSYTTNPQVNQATVITEDPQ